MQHCRVHRNEPRCLFKCVGANCSKTFTTYSAFKGHFYRVHNTLEPQAVPVVADLKCAVSLCARHFQTVKELVSHLKEHIGEGRSVSCPVSGCKRIFTKKSTFTSHMCRNHKECSPDGIADMYRETCPQPPNVIATDYALYIFLVCWLHFISTNMSHLEQSFLDDAILEVLPELPAVNRNILKDHFESIGVETYEDLRFVTEDDLMKVLKPVQARKVLSVWKHKCM